MWSDLETHAGWVLCKGCDAPITKRESDEDRGWCERCILLCLDCMDEEVYGPPEPLDLPSPRTDTEVTIPEPEDPGPPPNYDWIIPRVYKGDKPSFIEKIVSGIRRLFR
jgi:hypothetical protein